MSSYVIGVDLSTKRIDMAAVPLHDEPRLSRNVQLTHADIPQPAKGQHVDPAERAIRAYRAAATCLHTLHARGLEIHSCCVEYPAGKFVADVTQHAFAAVCCALDAYPVASRRPSEWRKLIGCVGRAVNSKPGGAVVVLAAITDGLRPGMYPSLTTDALDAIGVALAHRVAVLRDEEREVAA